MLVIIWNVLALIQIERLDIKYNNITVYYR